MNQGREILVGIVIIVAVAVLAGGTLFLKGARFGAELAYVDVLTADVGQLAEGNAVKFRGVSIGRVDRVGVEPGGHAVRLSLELESDRELPADAVVIIAPESLFGDWEAEIVSRARFPRYDYYEVARSTGPDGRPVIGGYAIPDISRLTATAEEVAENLGALTERFEQAFNEETAEALSQAIRDIGVVAGDVRTLIDQQAATFERVSADVESAANEISGAAVTGRRTLERVDSLLARGDVAAVVRNLRSATASLDSVVANLDRSTDGLDGTMAEMDSAVADVRNITRRIEAGEGSLGMLLADSALYVQAEQTLVQLDSLLADIRANPRRYINLSIF